MGTEKCPIILHGNKRSSALAGWDRPVIETLNSPDQEIWLNLGTRFCSLSWRSGSPSAAVFLFGLRFLLARTPSGFRVHVEAPWLETLRSWFDGV